MKIVKGGSKKNLLVRSETERDTPICFNKQKTGRAMNKEIKIPIIISTAQALNLVGLKSPSAFSRWCRANNVKCLSNGRYALSQLVSALEKEELDALEKAKKRNGGAQ